LQSPSAKEFLSWGKHMVHAKRARTLGSTLALDEREKQDSGKG